MSRYSSSGSAGSTGLGILGVLEVIFIVLKLLKLIDWSWWLVLIPLWIDLGIAALVIICAIIIPEEPDAYDVTGTYNNDNK